MAGDSFDFGKNWEKFRARYLNEERIGKAQASLTAFCGGNALKGKTFLDVGCGSGLFSLAALRLGASKIVSFDVNPASVRSTEILWRREGSPSYWSVSEGSVLDQAFLVKLGVFDFVYAWGVLHHTGDMWRALARTAALVKDGGLFYLAIYNKADGFAFYPDGRFGPSGFWAWEKRIYTRLPPFGQGAVDLAVMGILTVLYLLTFKNPVEKIRGHCELRGMSWAIDIKDWLGGYPYEYASAGEVFRFVRDSGFTMRNLKSNNGLLNNEYLFEKKSRT